MQDTTRETLLELIEKAEELMNSRFARIMAQHGQRFDITSSQGGSTTFEHMGPDKEAVDAYLLTFRLFMQQNEAISVIGQQPGMRLLLQRDPGLSQRFRDKVGQNIREMNASLDEQPSFPVVLDGKASTRREVLEKFVYGDRAHINNKEKRAEFKKWRSIPPVYLFNSNEYHALLYQLLFGIRLIQLLCQEELGLREVK